MDPNSSKRNYYIIGLGNPEPRYNQSLHNAGYAILEHYAKTLGVSFTHDPQINADVCNLLHLDRQIALIKPTAGMNDSGQTMQRIREIDPGFAPERCLIVYDELALQGGEVRYAADGRDAGHRGMRSMLSACQTTAVPRIRLGIGPDPGGAKRFAYVTEPVSDDRWQIVMNMADRAIVLIDRFLKQHV